MRQQGCTGGSGRQEPGWRFGLAARLKQFPIDGASQPNDGGSQQAERHRLREEVRRLTMEREVLKKATAFVAMGSP